MLTTAFPEYEQQRFMKKIFLFHQENKSDVLLPKFEQDHQMQVVLCDYLAHRVRVPPKSYLFVCHEVVGESLPR